MSRCDSGRCKAVTATDAVRIAGFCRRRIFADGSVKRRPIGKRISLLQLQNFRAFATECPSRSWTSCCECAVSPQIPPYLKLRATDSADMVRPDVADLSCLGELCQAFAKPLAGRCDMCPSRKAH